RDRVIDALAGRRERLEAFCRSLLTRVRARDMTAPRLLAESIEGLIGCMDEIANVDGVADLSQRLAEHGLLPMFGFPTQVRHLYTRQPRASRPWPPPGAIDRDLRVAVSEFAPGNEIVVDKHVFRSVGCVGYRPRSFGDPEPLANPL